MTASTDETFQCEVCGRYEREEYLLDIFHRGCRLKTAFPEATTETDGLVALDMTKLAEIFAKPKAVTSDGVEFERWSGGRVSISVRVQVANTISDWSWWLTADEWQAVIAAMAEESRQ